MDKPVKFVTTVAVSMTWKGPNTGKVYHLSKDTPVEVAAADVEFLLTKEKKEGSVLSLSPEDAEQPAATRNLPRRAEAKPKSYKKFGA